MKLHYLSSLILSFSLFTGCNGIPIPTSSSDREDGFLKIHSSFPLPYFHIGSATQWNENYAVTVGHIPMIGSVVHKCSTGCDLKFIAREANGKVPHWRKYQPGEQVTAVGNSPLGLTVASNGQALNATFEDIYEGAGEIYSIHSAPVVQGMSGGPVYGQDGSVLGITRGIHSSWLNPESADALDSEVISIFVDYETINREWKIFKNNQNGTEH